jgi:phosphonopyruvate decarboxylase
MIIDSNVLLNCFIDENIDFFTGVPDSLLKEFCWAVNRSSIIKHIVAGNEAQAIALAAGAAIGSGNPSVVYLQNSGLGNIINPLTSICSNDVYSVPTVLLIGHRGYEADEPQHRLIGRSTVSILNALDIECYRLDENFKDTVKQAVQRTRELNRPVAILTDYKIKWLSNIDLPAISEGPDRYEVIKKVYDNIPKESLLVSTCGMTSRELMYIHRSENRNLKILPIVGGMGLASSMARGLSEYSTKRIYCLDGDGAQFMHLSSMLLSNKNIFHIVFNNGTHASVGSHPTLDPKFEFYKLAEISGYDTVKKVTVNDITEINLLIPGSVFFEIIVNNKQSSVDYRPDELLSYKHSIK